MKILQIVPGFTGGGAENLVLELHQMFLKRKIESYIISFTGMVPANMPNVESLGLRNAYSPLAVLLLSRAMKKIKAKIGEPHIVHVHLTPCQILAPFSLRLVGIKTLLISTEHSTSNRRRGRFLGRIVDTLLYKTFDSIVCVSSAVENSLTKWLPGFERKFVSIPNGIDLKKFNKLTFKRRRGAKIVIVSMSRLYSLKNHMTALESLSMLSDVDFEYYILGTGPEETKIRRKIADLNLKDKVFLEGFCSDIGDYLSKADIFLLTSLWEGFGLAVVEAMAAGLPVVVSNIDGVRDIVGTDNKCGFLVNPKDSFDIGKKLRILSLDSEMRLSMGNHAKARAGFYSIDKTVNGYLNHYRKLLFYDSQENNSTKFK